MVESKFNTFVLPPFLHLSYISINSTLRSVGRAEKKTDEKKKNTDTKKSFDELTERRKNLSNQNFIVFSFWFRYGHPLRGSIVLKWSKNVSTDNEWDQNISSINVGSIRSNSSFKGHQYPMLGTRSSRVRKDPLEGNPYRWQQQTRYFQSERYKISI